MLQLGRYILTRFTIGQARIRFNRRLTYRMAHGKSNFKRKKDWLQPLSKINGTAGRWIAPPGTSRQDDEVVLMYAHGGGHVYVDVLERLLLSANSSNPVAESIPVGMLSSSSCALLDGELIIVTRLSRIAGISLKR